MLETSVLVRHLTGQPPEMAVEAARIIDESAALVITDVVLVETAYVLTSVYRVTRSEVVDSLVAFMQRPDVQVLGLEKNFVIQGLLMCRPSARVSFGDALIWAAARSAGTTILYSFDERFPSEGLEIRRRFHGPDAG